MINTRITNKLMSNTILGNLLLNRSKLNDLQEQISSGKQLNVPSDNPTGAMSVLSDQTSLYQMDGYIKNIDQAKSELEITDKSLLSAVDVIHRARELSVQAANATSGPTELSSINYEIKQLLSIARDLANTKIGSKYLYGGMVTDTAPFQTVAPGEIQYVGTPSTGNWQRVAEISEGVTVNLNLPGDKIFGQYYLTVPGDPTTAVGSGLINTLTTLSNELETVPPNYDNIRSKIENLDTDLSTMLNAQADIGGTLSRLEMTQNKLQDDKITFTKRKSAVQDIDLAKVISDAKFQETALEASLQVSAKVIQSSLLNYLS